MDNLEKLKTIFSEVFSVDESIVNEDFCNKSVDNWDSIHQLSLTTAVEDEFDIMLDAEDIIEFTSFASAKKVLEKYDIEIE